MSEPITIPVTVLPHAAELPLPSYATPGAAGMDLLAALPEPLVLPPGARVLVPTGLTMALPAGFEAQVRPRSGLALKHGITVLNSPGTIDSDYRGELKVLLVNLGHEAFSIEPAMRIAQVLLAPVTRGTWQPVDALPDSERGSGGFGSTGTAGV